MCCELKIHFYDFNLTSIDMGVVCDVIKAGVVCDVNRSRCG